MEEGKIWIQMIMFIVASSAVMVIHCRIWFEQKSQLRGTFRGGGGINSILKHLYLNDHAEFNSKIWNIMFLHNYRLVCEISTVGSLALSKRVFCCCFDNKYTIMIGFSKNKTKHKPWLESPLGNVSSDTLKIILTNGHCLNRSRIEFYISQ